MPKINVYLPDELAEAVKEAALPVSAICQRALEQAIRRITAIRETALNEVDDAALTARLPHFTARTRTVLRLGIEQARSAGAPAVGTGHLLAGMLAEGKNVALQVLRAEEIEPDAVGRDLARQSLAEPGYGPDAPPERFSAAAANALELAVTEATALGHNYVGTEHLLLGLIAEPEGVGGQVLRSLGAELRLTRRAVTAWLAGYVHLRTQASGDPGTTAHPGATAPAGGSGTAPAGESTLAGPAGSAGSVGSTPSAPGPALTGPAAAMLAAAIRQELRPLLSRIEKLEERLGVATAES